MAEIRNINYNGRDFDGLKTSLIDYIKQYYPTTYTDFNRSSPLMAILDAVAYVGDQINFYQDKSFNDLFLTETSSREAIFNWAKNFSYTPKPNTPSYTLVDVSVTFPTPSLSANLAFILKRGTQFLSTTDPQIYFELKSDISFYNPTSANAVFTTTDEGLKITKQGVAIAGETRTQSVNVGVPAPFYNFDIADSNISEVLSISSSDGNTWYQVPTLAQDYIIQGLNNPDSSSSAVPYFLNLLYTERRYEVTRTSNSATNIGFGASYISNENIISIPNPEDFVVNNQYRGNEENFIIKPSGLETFLNNSSLGALPINTTLYVKYRVGGGTSTNVPANTITVIRNAVTTPVNQVYADANKRNYSIVLNSLEVNNPISAEGGENEESIESIVRNIRLQQYAQQRLISEQDYEFFTKQMPVEYGTIFRSKAKYNRQNNNIELSILSKNSANQLTLPHEYLKQNLKEYFNIIRPIDDSIQILSGNIINIGLVYALVIDKAYNQSEVVVNSINAIKNFLSINNWDMDEPISKTELIQFIQTLDGILSVSDLQIINITGTVNGKSYSDYAFNVELNSKNNFVYPTRNSMFEIKYPETDIKVQII